MVNTIIIIVVVILMMIITMIIYWICLDRAPRWWSCLLLPTLCRATLACDSAWPSKRRHNTTMTTTTTTTTTTHARYMLRGSDTENHIVLHPNRNVCFFSLRENVREAREREPSYYISSKCNCVLSDRSCFRRRLFGRCLPDHYIYIYIYIYIYYI